MADVPGSTPPPPPPIPPGDSLPPRGVGDILTAAFKIYRDNASSLILIVAVVVIPLSFVSNFLGGVVFAPAKKTATILGRQVTTVTARSFAIALLLILVAAGISVIINAVLQAAILRGTAQATIGDLVDVGASYRWGFRRFGSVIFVSVLVALVVFIGLLLLVIPGVIFLVMLSVSIPAVVIENRRGTEAMSRSWTLVRGHFWHALGLIIVTAILTGLVSGLIGALGSGYSWAVRWMFGAIGQIVVAPYTALTTVLLYLDLRARKETLTTDRLRAELASSA